MAAGLDPLKRKLAPVRSGARNLLGAGKVHQSPQAIASAKGNPFLTVTEQSVDVPKGYADQILRQYDPTGSGNPMGAKAPIPQAATFDTAATELDTAILSSVAGTLSGSKEPKAMSMQRTGTDKNFEMAFQMPKRKKRRSLYDIGGTA